MEHDGQHGKRNPLFVYQKTVGYVIKAPPIAQKPKVEHGVYWAECGMKRAGK